MTLWFLTIAVLGLVQIIQWPVILEAINPLYAVRLAKIHGWQVLFIFGAVVLCVTGVEAMYADLGHFGRPAITRSWLFFVFPCLLLNYLGQGAFLLSGQPVPENHLFYALVPDRLILPMVILSTIATIIASQALISGAFSLTQQAIAMGLFPRVDIVHTNPAMPGQIYLPFINDMLLIGCIWLVIAFKSSSALAAAYGLAVTGAMLVTTVTFSFVAFSVFKWHKGYFVPLMLLIVIIDLLFFSANLLKFAAGGYVPVLIGLLVYIVMDTWRWGRHWISRVYQKHLKTYGMTVESMLEKKRYNIEQGASISLVVMASRPIVSKKDYVPLVLAVHYNNWRRMPKHVIFFSLVQQGSPYIRMEEERYKINTFKRDEEGTVVSVQVFYGYMERPNIRRLLKELKSNGLLKIPLDAKRWLILIGAERFVNLGGNFLERWRIRLFSRMNRLSKPFTDYFGLEADPGVTMETLNV